MRREYVGKDAHGRCMYLYHSCTKVYCDHEDSKGKIRFTTSLEVSNEIMMQLNIAKLPWADVYEEIRRKYKRRL